MACLLKLAILTQLHHIFVVGKGKLHRLLIGLGIFVIAFYISIMITRILQCVPREKIWNEDVPGSCVSSTGIIVASGAVNAILDINLFVIPISMTLKIQMSKHLTLAIVAVFAVGLL